MEDTAFPERASMVGDLCALLALYDGGDVKALDLRGLNAFTDFFIIATTTSSTHRGGLMKRVKDFLGEKGIDVLGRHRGKDDDDWSLVDCGWLVIHLMSGRARAFYEIEKLWFQAKPMNVSLPGKAKASAEEE